MAAGDRGAEDNDEGRGQGDEPTGILGFHSFSFT
jgi:hypothetical protein